MANLHSKLSTCPCLSREKLWDVSLTWEGPDPNSNPNPNPKPGCWYLGLGKGSVCSTGSWEFWWEVLNMALKVLETTVASPNAQVK